MTQFAFQTYTGNGSTTQYSISWTYIDSTHVACFLDGVSTSAFSVSGATVTFNSAPANNVVIRIERQTPLTARLVDFQDGSVLTEADLDMSANQNFFAVQEFSDDATNYMQVDTDDKYNAQSKVIKSVANPVNDNDAVNKTYLENTWLSTANKTALTTVSGISADVTTVAGISANVTTVANDATDIGLVATNIGSVNTVAADITKVIAVANDLAEAVSEVETVANDLNEATSEIDTVANAITNVDTVGTNIANVNTVGGISANVTTVAGISADVTSVAGISTAVTNVNSNSTNINAVNTNSANINTVAGIDTDVTSVAGISSAVSAVNSNSTNINAVNANSTNINTVAGNNTNINTVATNNANITSVAGVSANVTTVATDIANVNSVATNIASVNSFANSYRIGATDPTTSLDEGDLFYNSTANVLKYYTGTAWQQISSDTDVKTLVSANDTTAGFLNGKLVAGSNVTFTENNDGGDETLSISATDNSIPFAIALG